MKYINNPDIFIKENATIEEAMKKLNKASTKNIYSVDFENRLVGSLSDGDIRRGLLKGYNLQSKIENIININPKYIYNDEINMDEKVKNIILSTGIQSLPIIDKGNKVIKVAFWIDVFNEKTNYNYRYKRRSNKVFLLAGGLGTRLKPFTNILPKPLLPIKEKPIIEEIMDRFSKFGFDNFILSLNYKADMIKLYMNDGKVSEKYDSIEYLVEDKPMGTIGSLYLAKEHIDETFFISNSDILIDENFEEIFKYHKIKNSIFTIVGCVKETRIPYGVLNVDENHNLIQIDEKPSYTNIVNTGIYVAEPEIINFLKEEKKMDINQLLETLIRAKQKISVYGISEEQWFDVGQWEEYERTRKIFEVL